MVGSSYAAAWAPGSSEPSDGRVRIMTEDGSLIAEWTSDGTPMKLVVHHAGPVGIFREGRDAGVMPRRSSKPRDLNALAASMWTKRPTSHHQSWSPSPARILLPPTPDARGSRAAERAPRT